MTALTVRRLLVDLETPFARHWNGGDAFRSAYFDALSMSFPVGEQFFIDSVRAGVGALPADQRAAFDDALQGFVGQEATHRRIHALFNAQLARQGYDNAWERRILRRLEKLKGVADPRHAVAITAALEHFTAILARHLFEHPQVVDGAEPRLQALWFWHASEESEHRSVAFDVYRALGGSLDWRRRWMRLVTWHFTTDVMRQTARNLGHDRALWRWRTWTSAASFLFGRHGVVRHAFGPWRAYFRADFHPSQQPAPLAEQWLREHATDYAVVSR
ncbi:MAG TPA: metal-dependent hydrolase [Albitalea sp.]